MPVLYFCVSIEHDPYVGEIVRLGVFIETIRFFKNEPDVWGDGRSTGYSTTVMRTNPPR